MESIKKAFDLPEDDIFIEDQPNSRVDFMQNIFSKGDQTAGAGEERDCWSRRRNENIEENEEKCWRSDEEEQQPEEQNGDEEQQPEDEEMKEEVKLEAALAPELEAEAKWNCETVAPSTPPTPARGRVRQSAHAELPGTKRPRRSRRQEINSFFDLNKPKNCCSIRIFVRIMKDSKC